MEEEEEEGEQSEHRGERDTLLKHKDEEREKRKERREKLTEEERQKESLDRAKAHMRTLGQKQVIDFVLDALCFCLMAQWDFALRASLPTDTFVGIWMYACSLVLFAGVVATIHQQRLLRRKREEEKRQREEAEEEGRGAMEVTTRTVWTKVDKYVSFVIENQTWLIALAFIAVIGQTFEETKITVRPLCLPRRILLHIHRH